MRANAAIYKALLFSACTHGDEKQLARLLRAGVDVHADTEKPLRLALEKSDVKITEILLDAGASLSRLLEWSAEACGAARRILPIAANLGNFKVVRALLDAGVDFQTYNNESLLNSVWNGHADIVALLITKGANVAANEHSALKRACIIGHLNVVQLLSTNVDWENLSENPARLAWNRHHDEIVRYLLSMGALPFKDLWSGYRSPSLDIIAAIWSKHVFLLPPRLVAEWLQSNCPDVCLRTLRWSHRARAALDHPPTEPLGTQKPTREQLIAHLKTAGRRFARDYWTEGVPLFLEGVELGEVPEEFREVKFDTELYT